jgi:hypothetical protein
MYPWWMGGVQMGLSAEDEALVASIVQGGNEERHTLADIILEKKLKKRKQKGIDNCNNNILQIQITIFPLNLPPKVVAVYTDIGKNYCHGEVTESIPGDTILEQLGRCLVFWTRPDDHWTPPQAMLVGGLRM